MAAEDGGEDGGGRRAGKSAAAFRTISEVAVDLDVPPHVLRFWETKFAQIRPLKRGGGRRYYRPEDVELLRRIRALLYGEGYTIKGVQRLLKDGLLGREGAAEEPAEGEAELPAELALQPAAAPASRDTGAMRDVLSELLELKSLLSSVRR